MTPPHRERASRRIDLLLVERGLVPSREKAQAMILAGLVRAGGRRIEKAGTLVALDLEIEIAALPRFVGRGGEKIDGALDALGLVPRGLSVLDVGASTGGFTDCLLQRGARHVLALDVGRGQLDWSLRNDPRVSVVEGVNVRYLEPSDLPGPFDLIVVDVSFISLRLILSPLVPLLGMSTSGSEPHSRDRNRNQESDPDVTAASAGPAPDSGTIPRGPAEPASPTPPMPGILALVKPQFEVGRSQVGRGGIVRDAELHLSALLGVLRFAAGTGDGVSSSTPDPRLGAWRILESPIRGAEGNREFFVFLVPGYDRPWAEVEEEARKAVAGAADAQRT